MPQSLANPTTSLRPLWRQFLVFVLPLIATNILQSLSMTINTIFVGQLLGVNAVAAIAVFMPVLFMLIAFVIGISAGATVIVGQAFGAKNFDSLYSAIGAMVFLCGLLGLVMAGLGIAFTPAILNGLGVAPDIAALSRPYFYTMMAGCPIIFIFIAITSALRGIGDSVTPLLALSFSIVCGLLITPALIKGWWGVPQLGVMAAAIATLTGQLLSSIFIIWYLRYRQRALQFNCRLLREIRFNPRMMRLILRLGIPTGVQMITTSLAGLIIIRLINDFGSEATAAYGAINQIIGYVQFPALSIAIAASIFAAQAIGAARGNELRKITRMAMLFNLVFTGGLVALGYVFSRVVIGLFITDAAVVDLGQTLLHITLWSMIVFGATAILSAIMRASGTVWAPMLISLTLLLAVELPLAYYLSGAIGLKGIWYSYVATFVLTFVAMLAFYWWVWRRKAIRALI